LPIGEGDEKKIFEPTDRTDRHGLKNTDDKHDEEPGLRPEAGFFIVAPE